MKNYLLLGLGLAVAASLLGIGSSQAFLSASPNSGTQPLPVATHSDITFAGIDPEHIDLAATTVDIFDAVPVADSATADGFLSLQDGRVVTAFFEPGVVIDGSLYLVNADAHKPSHKTENIHASLSLGTVPQPSSLALLALGIISLVVARRKI